MTIEHISEIATILLALRLITIFYIVRVIVKQIELFKYHIDTGLVRFRKTMLALSIVFLLGNIIPILMDSYYAFFEKVFDTNDWVIVVYAISNTLMSLAAAVVLWMIYKIAAKDID
jgi:hypothetical protein